jgi:hypothetical protein
MARAPRIIILQDFKYFTHHLMQLYIYQGVNIDPTTRRKEYMQEVLCYLSYLFSL